MTKEQNSAFLERLTSAVEEALQGGDPGRLMAPSDDAMLQRIAVAVNELIRCVDIDGSSAERRLAEAALRRSEALLRESQEVARLGTYTFDVVSGTWESSPMLDVVFGIPAYHPKTVEGWLQLVHLEEREALAEHLMDHVIRDGQPFDREYRIVRVNDGQERWVYGAGRLELDGDGNPVSMLGTIQDIDARKRAELAQARLQSQLQHAQRLESVGRLAGGVAHDFNNMLTVIIGYTSMLKRKLVDDLEGLDSIAEIERATRQAQGVTRQLLAFSRHQVSKKEQLDLNEVVEASRQALVRLIGEHVVLRSELAEGLWEVASDASQIAQVLVNLAINARDAMPQGGELSFETANVRLDDADSSANLEATPGEFVRLTVTDTGVGMSPDVLDHIFEPFFTTKEVGRGTGLGLSTVYGIVRQHGGFIDVRSTPGSGSSFRIFLPRSRQVTRPSESSPSREPVGRGAGSVLLVEDDELVRRVTAALLRSGGFEVSVCSSPRGALQLLEQEDVVVDLILTDVVMPGMNGVELREQVHVLRPGIAVLFMSGYTANALEEQGVEHERVNLLQKPFTRNELVTKVAELIAAGTD